jgi:hypothetical protein
MASGSFVKPIAGFVHLCERPCSAIARTLNSPGRVAAIVASLIFAAFACSAAAGQNPHPGPGPVIGVIDDVRYETDRYYVFGWACQQGNRGSIDVHIYANHAAGDTPAGTFITSGTANLDNEPAVDRECHDANGGKHRFKIELPNQLLRTFQKKKLFAHGIAIVGNVENAAIAGSGRFQFPKPAWPPDPPTPDLLDGPRVATFDTARDSCEQIDIPDAQARAFRDYKGTVHLVASHYVMRASLGPTLESAKHNCQVAYNSRHDGNPANFDDATWLDSFYSLDGKRIVALGHMEYHGWEHGMCRSKTDTNDCWYNADTFHMSDDGGYHFTSPKPPANYVLGLPYKYEVSKGPEGYSVDANIVKAGNWYYAMATGWPWPPNCGQGKGARPCLVPGGAAPIRTANILDPASWRGWDGKDFSIVFADPYRSPVARPQDHVYTPVPHMDCVNAINFHEASHTFIATLWDPWNTAYGPPGLYFSTSADLIHWSKPALAITQDQLLRREPEGNWSYMYFSLLDPKSTDANYSMITDSPYLYYVRMDDNHGPYKRVLFRQKIKLDWLTKSHQNSGASSGAISGEFANLTQ